MSSAITSPSQFLLDETADLRQELLHHPVYQRICDQKSLRCFMQHHVFAVLDFMWLLKRLQRELTCCNHPWLPPASPELARFVNEIVLGEESDENGHGGYGSHFELYLDAMSDVGADQSQIDSFQSALRGGMSVSAALAAVDIPDSVRQFVTFTDSVSRYGTSAEVACVFCLGREDVIPDMFQRLLHGFDLAGLEAPRLRYYIQRHIELDGDQHGPLTRRMVDQLCSSGPLMEAALKTSREAIQRRIQLWDGVVNSFAALD
jgi:hypothetical protein